MQNVISIVLGGGRGTRLYPLTKYRSKPAVPLAGKYRLIDIPISNCINSGLNKMYVLTQFLSVSLHRHIRQTYRFDQFNGGFVEILAAQQMTDDAKHDWYQGTADAVRKQLRYMQQPGIDYVVILSGDQLYRMDYRDLLRTHVESKADATIAGIPVTREQAKAFGIMRIADSGRVEGFLEKPQTDKEADIVRMRPDWIDSRGIASHGRDLIASMGIYVFNRDTLIECLEKTDYLDFGKEIFPASVRAKRVMVHLFDGYWEDIGTIRNFFEANLDVTSELPRFNFFDMSSPIFSRPRFLPGSKINGAQIDHAVISDGCIINHASINQSVVGLRSIVGAGTVVNRCILLGSDYYESFESIIEHEKAGKPRIGIGARSRIENTIVDKNARIGNNVIISPAGKPDNLDHANFYVRDGIVIIPKNGVIPHGMVI